MPDETGGQVNDISERDGQYVPILTNLEEDVIQVHTVVGIPHAETPEIRNGDHVEIQIDVTDTLAYLKWDP